MPKYCAAEGCGNSVVRCETSAHTFPKDEKLCYLWSRLARPSFPTYPGCCSWWTAGCRSVPSRYGPDRQPSHALRCLGQRTAGCRSVPNRYGPDRQPSHALRYNTETDHLVYSTYITLFWFCVV
ncbi:hypothetical protein ISCGN_010246 [Ixodes scapularis]